MNTAHTVTDVEAIIANAPDCLKQRPQWVCWKYVKRNGKATKCPINARTGALADSTDPSTWSTFDEAITAYRAGNHLDGVGYVFAADDPYTGIDLDDCIDPVTGELKLWGRREVASLNTYTEISPSGGGVKAIAEGSKPGERCRKAFEDGEVEMYDKDRFFTITGQRLDEVSPNVEARQAEIDKLYSSVFGPKVPPQAPVPPPSPSPVPASPPLNDVLSDGEILEKAQRSRKSGAKFSALWGGQWNDHFNSQSEADSSVVFTLAFYTKDAGQIDRMFRTSGLMRPKWDEKHGAKTYGQTTIDRALEQVTAQWQPKKKSAKDSSKANGPPVPVKQPGDPNLPKIVIDDIQLRELTQQAIVALDGANQPSVVFVRGGGLCRVIMDEKGVPKIDAFDKVRMRGRLTQAANFFKVVSTKNGPVLVSTNPPVPLAENLITLGVWPFPSLMGIASVPILRNDGTICTTPGYDAQSKLIYCPAPGLKVPPIPDDPSDEGLLAAVDSLRQLIAEFPFVDKASFANAMAILFTVLMRPVIRGHVPMAVVGAPMQGTGKTLLIFVLVTIAVGQVSGESIPSKDNEDEWRKKITSLLLAGAPVILLDNIPDNSSIDSPSLAAALTSHEWSDRLLGGNITARLPSRAVWVATGNNLRITGDMPRRCYSINLDANVERPWERTGFAITDIEQYVQEHRGELLAAAFSIIRGWYAAGCPKAQVPVIGSFQEWADTIGSVLAFAGIEGFLGNLSETRAVQDEDTQQWGAFFSAWWDQLRDQAVTVDMVHRQLLTRVDSVALPEPLLIHRDKGDGSLKRSLGRHLSRLSGRVFDGRKLHSPGEDSHTKVRLWCLQPIANPANPAVSNLDPASNPAHGDVE